MNPAFSVLVFTTAAGAGQGLGRRDRAGAARRRCRSTAALVQNGLLVATVLLVVGLGRVVPPSRPARARLARGDDVAHVVAVARGDRPAGVHRAGRRSGGSASRHVAARPPLPPLPLAAIALAALLWWCTAMIYACLRFIEEWAQPLTIVNFVLLGMSSGLVVRERAGGAARRRGRARDRAFRRRASSRSSRASRGSLALRRNARIRHRSTLQSATGIRADATGADVDGNVGGLVQHARVLPRRLARRARQDQGGRDRLRVRGAGARPRAGLVGRAAAARFCVVALLVQAPGLLADRWLFFAQAKHPQNLYYQIVS